MTVEDSLLRIDQALAGMTATRAVHVELQETIETIGNAWAIVNKQLTELREKISAPPPEPARDPALLCYALERILEETNLLLVRELDGVGVAADWHNAGVESIRAIAAAGLNGSLQRQMVSELSRIVGL